MMGILSWLNNNKVEILKVTAGAILLAVGRKAFVEGVSSVWPSQQGKVLHDLSERLRAVETRVNN